MKKIISCALVAGVISLGAVTQASAGYEVNHLVDKANHLRAMHNSLNKKASEIEATIRHYKAHGYATYHMEKKAGKMRKKAKKLALQANSIAKHAFDHGLHRDGHAHATHGHGHHGGATRHAVPELDPATAAGALALIVAAVLVFYGARKRT